MDVVIHIIETTATTTQLLSKFNYNHFNSNTNTNNNNNGTLPSSPTESELRNVDYGLYSTHLVLSIVCIAFALVEIVREYMFQRRLKNGDEEGSHIARRKRFPAWNMLTQVYLLVALAAFASLIELGILKLVETRYGSILALDKTKYTLRGLRFFFYYAAYLRILFFWIKAYSPVFGTYVERRLLFKTSARIRACYLIVCLLLLLACLVIFPISRFFDTPKNEDKMYMARGLCLFVIALVLALFFAVFCIRLLLALRRTSIVRGKISNSSSGSAHHGNNHTKKLVIVLFVSITGFLCNIGLMNLHTASSFGSPALRWFDRIRQTVWFIILYEIFFYLFFEVALILLIAVLRRPRRQQQPTTTMEQEQDAAVEAQRVYWRKQRFRQQEDTTTSEGYNNNNNNFNSSSSSYGNFSNPMLSSCDDKEIPLLSAVCDDDDGATRCRI